jgi:hypothetical protein
VDNRMDYEGLKKKKRAESAMRGKLEIQRPKK